MTVLVRPSARPDGAAPPQVVLAAVAMLAAGLGLVAGPRPAMAVAAAVAVACVAVTMSELSLGVALFTVAVFFPELGLAKAAGLLLALSWLATVVLKRERPSLLTSRPLFAGVVTLFVAWAALGLLWARRPDPAATAVVTLVLGPPLSPILSAAGRDPRHVRRAWVAFVTGALLTAIIGLLVPGSALPDEEGRL